jgi:two-component system, chemotaxis family, sensor kinase CheA
MSADFSPELRGELLNEFYSEADEHLNAIRDALVALESSVGRAQIDQSVLEKLFRNFHSFKGISAIVGLKPAEALSHAAEDRLRDLSRGAAVLSADVVDLLMTVAHRLEQIVRAHRENEPLPGIDSVLTQVKSVTASRGEKVVERPASREISPSQVAADVEVARARGAVVWLCTFVPSPELDARGVNVNAVRARLGKIGEILRGIPEVRPGGKIAFDFVVSLRETLSDLDAWEKDGVTFRPLENPTIDSPASAHAESPVVPTLESEHNPFVAPSHVVRVDLVRLDELMRITGELVVHRSRLEQQLSRTTRGEATLDVEELDEVNASFARSLRDLRESIMRVRLVPVAEIFSRMPFVVRDLAHETGKKIRLNLSGQQTEIDKFLVERLKDPLLHLVRNSVSHGIEGTQERLAGGKPADATISLSASTVGDHVLIEVADDGRGVDPQHVARRAASHGLRVPENLDSAAVLNLLCKPGFSTRDEADRAAGRGVGMAVVNNVVRELGGTLAMQSEPGQGTRFILRLPLTLAIAEAFIVSSGEQTFAVPQSFVQEILQMTADQVHRVNRTELLPYRDSVLPLFRLGSLLRAGDATRLRSLVLVLSSERGSVGLVVDQIHGQREIVVRSIRDPLVKVPGVAGATELGDGKPILILDAAALTEGVVRPHAHGTRLLPRPVSMAIAS